MESNELSNSTDEVKTTSGDNDKIQIIEDHATSSKHIFTGDQIISERGVMELNSADDVR